MSNLRKTFFPILAFLALTLTASVVKADTINFDTGTPDNSVGSFYSALGVTFTNATFDSNGFLPGGTAPNAIRATVGDNNGYFVSSANPIAALFSLAQTSVSLTGVDVGAGGFRMVAYNALVGGSVVDTQTVFGSGIGVGEFYTLTVTGSNILRIEFFQVTPGLGGDGIVFDNLVYGGSAPVPEPATMLLFGMGLAGTAGAIRKRRNKSRA
jgi:hypothetical protein